MRSSELVIGVLILLIGSSLPLNAQVPTTTPSPQPNSGGQNRTDPRQDNRRINAGFENLRSLEIVQNPRLTKENILREVVDPLYRKPGKKELKHLLPTESLLSQYKNFLQQSDTGIFKLSADSACEANLQVVVATESCVLSSIPGAGTAYSFRVRSHRMLHLSDLVLDKNVIRTGSLLQQGIMVKLGDIELDEISAQSEGLKYLIDFKPPTNNEELQDIEEKLGKGIKYNGFTYSYGLYVADKTTFALRSVAYRSKMLRSVGGVEYNEMDFDKRNDIMVVFRVVEKDANGDLTILWKEISRKESPAFKIDKKGK